MGTFRWMESRGEELRTIGRKHGKSTQCERHPLPPQPTGWSKKYNKVALEEFLKFLTTTECR